MNEVRRVRIGTEVAVLSDVIRRLNGIIETEGRALTNLPDSIEHSLFGHGSAHAMKLMVDAGQKVLEAMGLLEQARLHKNIV